MSSPLALFLSSLCASRSLSLYRCCRLSHLSIGASSAIRRNNSMRTDTLISLLFTLSSIKPLTTSELNHLLSLLLPSPPLLTPNE